MVVESFLYSKKHLFFIRLFSGISLLILVIATSIVLENGEKFNSIERLFISNYATIILNLCCIICFSILLFHPEKLIALSIISGLYALYIFIDEPSNQMGILMALLCFYTLNIRNFFYKNKFPKIVVLVWLFTSAIFSEIRFGINTFLSSIFDSLAFLFIIILILFFFKEQQLLALKKQSSIKILNLFPYIGTRKEDVQLLKLVLEKKQYLEISQIVFRTEGTVRNRLNKLYDILGVADRIGFVTTYVGYEIVYDETIETENCKLSSMKEEEGKFEY